jgi:adenine phosphoribosyltransferase
MENYLRLVDTHTQGRRYDVTPLFADPQAFAALVEDLIHPFAEIESDCVAGIDALGFILGAAIAVRLDKGFVPIRKGGKLPVQTDTAKFVDYTAQKKSLELRIGAIRSGTRVLVVDEWVETGAQVQAAIELLERQGGVVIGVATINMEDNAITRLLRSKYQCHSVWRDD